MTNANAGLEVEGIALDEPTSFTSGVIFSPEKAQDEAGGFFFNGPNTLAKKVKLAKERGLGGAMIWEIGQDAKGEDSLLRQVVAAEED